VREDMPSTRWGVDDEGILANAADEVVIGFLLFRFKVKVGLVVGARENVPISPESCPRKLLRLRRGGPVTL
jgi:hypothetical protein